MITGRRMNDFGFLVYDCPHASAGTKPCPNGCHSEDRMRIVIPPTAPEPPTTCPACLLTGPEHTHGCRYCGGWECGCEAYREANEDAAKEAERMGAVEVAAAIRGLVKS